jgi:hypothetical protein
MRYIGKLWFKKPYPVMSIIANELRLKDMAIFDTQDIVGMMQWRGGEILVLLGLSSGDMANVQTLKLWVHHVEETEDNEFQKFVIAILKDMIDIEVTLKEKIYDYTIKHDGG